MTDEATANDDTQEDRLRKPPSERFAGDSHLFDLREALEKLRSEPHEGKGGHRQITLYHRSPVAQVLFAFEPGGRLDEHSTNGLVTIHALEGRLHVTADGEEHDLTPGRVLTLNPKIEHDVRATERSAMLLTVHMEKG